MNSVEIEIRGCHSVDELREVVELCDAAFPETPREYFERHILHDGTLAPEDTRILVKNGKIVSSVQVFPRTIYVGGKKMDVGGIGNVATLPSERKNGYAGMVMKDSMSHITAKGYPVSFLTTTINKYYEKFGFQTIKRHLGLIDFPHFQEYTSIRVFDAARDLDRVMKLYDQYNAGGIGPIVRDKNYWLSQFDFCGEDKDLFLVYEERGDIHGFVRANKKVDRIKVLEYAFAEHQEGIVQKLFEHLALKANLPKLELFVSEREKARLSFLKFWDLKVDMDFMVAFIDANFDADRKRILLKENELTFWLTDFF